MNGTPDKVTKSKCVCRVCKHTVTAEQHADGSWQVQGHFYFRPDEKYEPPPRVLYYVNPGNRVACCGDNQPPAAMVGEPYTVEVHDMFCQETSQGEEPDPVTGEMVYDCNCGKGTFPGEF